MVPGALTIREAPPTTGSLHSRARGPRSARYNGTWAGARHLDYLETIPRRKEHHGCSPSICTHSTALPPPSCSRRSVHLRSHSHKMHTRGGRLERFANLGHARLPVLDTQKLLFMGGERPVGRGGRQRQLVGGSSMERSGWAPRAVKAVALRRRLNRSIAPSCLPRAR